jgi:hypothetical protein
MRLFKCPACGQMLYFENVRCERCGHRLGYDPATFCMRALTEQDRTWQDAAAPGNVGPEQTQRWRFCANADQDACNWLIPAESDAAYCTACRHNRVIPDLSDADKALRWRALEGAKHRLFYSLLRLGLPLADRSEDPAHGLAFDFLAETPAQPHVLTGHDEGLITIALKEGDHAERERMREQMGEVYRTPLGHFRHEIGHHYWDLLVRGTQFLEPFRTVFGDESLDYAQALREHYERTPITGWQDRFVSLYATSHPWEDFAETWAHYLHIVDTLEMAASFGVSIHPKLSRDPALQTDISFDPYVEPDLANIVEAWLPLAFATNSLNRSMGQPDLYPFVLSDPVIEKLGFIHDIIRAPRGA